MKLWRATYYDNNGLGTCIEWHATKRAAEQAMRKALENGEGSTDDHGIDYVDVPTKKAEMIRWLNQNCNSNNG